MNSQLAAPTQNPERDIVEFVPFGAQESIKLSVAIVTNLIAVPTRSGKQPSRNDCIKFMMLCRARHLNPFEGDAFLLGYDTQNGPQFSLITAHQVFLKRAEACTQFDGMESGIVVQDSSGLLIERETDFILPGETLLGGWARVYRKDRTKPTYRRVNLSTFTTGRSRWEKDPAGMICKVAEADALRSTFPTHLGGLYSQGEIQTAFDATATVIPEGRIGQLPAPQRAMTPTEEAAAESQAPKPKPEPKDSGPTSDELQKQILKLGTALNAGKVRIAQALVEKGFLKDGQKLDDLDARTAAAVIDAWDDIKATIVPTAAQ